MYVQKPLVVNTMSDEQAVILCGGLGTRLREHTEFIPKPLIPIGNIPIIWHIMIIYSTYGYTDFVLCLGYKGELLKNFFKNFHSLINDFTINIKTNKTATHINNTDDWNITLVDTGKNTMTGGRIKQIEKYLDDQTFCLTYGDGLSDVNITELIEFHKSQKTFATITAVQPPGRFGTLILEKNKISNFKEKPAGDGKWINGGFFVLEPKVFDYIEGDNTIFERESLEKLSNDNQLSAFKHRGFWFSMDSLRDKNYLEDLWNSNKASWKTW